MGAPFTVTPGMCVAAADAAMERGIMLPASHAGEIIGAALAAAPVSAPWLPIETAPKSLANGDTVRGIYLLGFCPDESAIDPSSCICVVWWEPNIDGGVWYGEGGYSLRPTHWMHLPSAPSTPKPEEAARG